MHNMVSKQMCEWEGVTEGEWSDAGSCVDGEMGCRSSGTWGTDKIVAGPRPEGQIKTPGFQKTIEKLSESTEYDKSE